MTGSRQLEQKVTERRNGAAGRRLSDVRFHLIPSQPDASARDPNPDGWNGLTLGMDGETPPFVEKTEWTG